MSNQQSKKKTIINKAIELTNNHELFHDENKKSYITITHDQNKITYAIEGRSFRDWLHQKYIKTYNNYISSRNLQEAIEIINSKAIFSDKHRVFHRVAETKNGIYLDLGDDTYKCVKITPKGWGILHESPVKFVRNSTMQSLPLPISGKGDINLLWRNVNIPESVRILVLAWLLECFRTTTAFPILFLTGSQGSAKSTTQEVLKKLIDPNSSNLRGAPKKSEDLMVAAVNNYLLSFNNLSHLNSSQQDDFCCISTGGGYATRQLYTTCEEKVINIKRPCIMNGIAEVITANDLIERSLVLHLPQINSQDRISDSELIQQFEHDYPLIFSGLLDLLSKTLNLLPSVNLSSLPRMGDFAKLGTALETALDHPKAYFINSFNQNQTENEAMNLEGSPIIIALINFINEHLIWEGTFQNLYDILSIHGKPIFSGWPKSAKGLSEAIKRHESYLRKIGISISRSQRTKQGFLIQISFNQDNEQKNVHQVHTYTSSEQYQCT